MTAAGCCGCSLGLGLLSFTMPFSMLGVRLRHLSHMAPMSSAKPAHGGLCEVLTSASSSRS